MEVERRERDENKVSRGGTILPKQIVRISQSHDILNEVANERHSWSKQIVEHERNKKNDSA